MSSFFIFFFRDSSLVPHRVATYYWSMRSCEENCRGAPNAVLRHSLLRKAHISPKNQQVAEILSPLRLSIASAIPDAM